MLCSLIWLSFFSARVYFIFILLPFSMLWLLGKMKDATVEDEPTKFRCNWNNDFINMSRVDISRLFVVNDMDAEQKKILVNTTNEMQKEDAWLEQHLPIRLKSPFQNNKASLLDYAARFVSLVQYDCLDKKIQPLNLRINTIEGLMVNRLFRFCRGW